MVGHQDFDESVVGGHDVLHQGDNPVRVLVVRIGAAGKELFGYLCVALAGSPDEGDSTELVSCVDVGSVVDESGDNFALSFPDGDDQRRGALFILGLPVGVGGEQQLNELGVPLLPGGHHCRPSFGS